MRRGAYVLIAVAGTAGLLALASCRSSYPDVVWIEAAGSGEDRKATLSRPLPDLVDAELKVVGWSWVGDETSPRLVNLHDEDAFQDAFESVLGIGAAVTYVRGGVTCSCGGRELMAFGRPVGDLEFKDARGPWQGALDDVARERGPEMREQAERIRASGEDPPR